MKLRFTLRDLQSAFIAAVLLGGMAVLTAQPGGAPSNEIPPLAPPLPEIIPTFFEQHPVLRVVIPSAVTGFLLGLFFSIWFRPRKPPLLLAPAAQARNSLIELQAHPEDGALLSRVSNTIKRYLTNAFWLPPHEMTTSDFCKLIAKHEKIGQELAGRLGDFLRVCDERKFSPSTDQPPLGAATQALELINMAEAKRIASQATPASARPA